MSLRQKSRILIGILAAGLCIGLAGAFTEIDLMCALGILVIFAVLPASYMWMRCLHCGAWLGRDSGRYCKDCGEKIDWDQK